jgi:hypothetical protein
LTAATAGASPICEFLVSIYNCKEQKKPYLAPEYNGKLVRVCPRDLHVLLDVIHDFMHPIWVQVAGDGGFIWHCLYRREITRDHRLKEQWLRLSRCKRSDNMMRGLWDGP